MAGPTVPTFLGGFNRGLQQSKENRQADRSLDQRQRLTDLKEQQFQRQQERLSIEDTQNLIKQAFETSQKLIANAKTPEQKKRAIEFFDKNASPAIENIQLKGGSSLPKGAFLKSLAATPTGAEQREAELQRKIQEGQLENTIDLQKTAQENQLENQQIQNQINQQLRADPSLQSQPEIVKLQAAESQARQQGRTEDADQIADLIDAQAKGEFDLNQFVFESVTQQLINSGVPPEIAAREAAKRVKGLTTLGKDPLSDQPVLIDETTGQRISQPSQQGATGQQSGQQSEGQTAFENIEESTGFGDAVQNAFNKVPLVNTFFFDEETSKQNANIKLFNENAQRAIIKNPKFPVSEQKRIANLLPLAGSFFETEQNAFNKLNALKIQLEKDLRRNLKVANTESQSIKEREDAQSRVNSIRSVLDDLGEPKDILLKDVPIDAIRMLKENPDPSAIKEFNEIFGDGLAERALNGGQ